MNSGKSNWRSRGFIIFSTLFYVFALFFIVDCVSSIRDSDLRAIAPENLKNAPEYFSHRLRAESLEFPVENMTKAESWNEFQNTISAYAQRLELLVKWNRQRSLWILGLYLASGIGMLIFTILLNREKRT